MDAKSIKQPLPKGWRWAKLGDVAEYINGRAFKPKDWKTSGTPIIRIQNLNSEEAAFNYFDGDVEERYIIEDGDLLISWSASLDAFIWKRGTAILNQHIFKAIENKEVVRRDYLFYAVKEAMEEIRSQVHGATMKHITRPEFLAITIPLPPLEEQKRIAARLDEQLRHIEQARLAAEESLSAAWELQSKYLKQAFLGITPLSAGTTRDKAPKGWRWEKLTSIARLESGHTPSRYHAEWWGGDIPWIALPDIRLLDGKTTYETIEYTNELGIANSSARILPKGTVALSRTASVGFVTVMGREMATSQDFVNWVCGSELDPYFLMYLLIASRDYFRSISSGAIHKTVYMPTLKSLEVCIPPIEEQNRITAYLRDKISTSEALAESLESQLAEIESLPSAVLGQAFAGQL